MEKEEKLIKQAIIKVAEMVNQKRRQELLKIFSGKDGFLGYLKEIRNKEVYRKGSKSKVWRKIASMPIEVDRFFTALYGPDYYKDKDFFKKFPEWLTVDPKHL